MKNGNLIALQVWELDAVAGGASNKSIVSQSLGLVNDIKLPVISEYLTDTLNEATDFVRNVPSSPLL
ncbi:hypothetical protein QN360_05535 [Glaciimonas sp. CA11.2]|uniref:hypothetical protein n=1 Tax=Glaciimonas sp. CA11.2 TaxID=3048601 RepID=UPI002B23E332|nr:hypothetical protein [Glaciimonas sp. CA11.2]MEB0162367.1 hypothetical protein [Glaciimonas sp. CA11.2]